MSLLNIPLFSPSTINMKVISYSMVIQGITGKLKTLRTNLKHKINVRIMQPFYSIFIFCFKKEGTLPDPKRKLLGYQQILGQSETDLCLRKRMQLNYIVFCR